MTEYGKSLLGGQALEVAERVIEQESHARTHLVVYLSGAHAYGFPSPDSDVDLKAIHVAPTRALLGLQSPAPSADRMEVLDGVEVDYTSNEVGHALVGILKGNGNYIERVLGRAVLRGSPWLSELRPLVQRSLSRRLLAHYRGFAHQQAQELASTPTVKKLLYVVRTALTGIHALRSGEIVTDVRELIDQYGLAEVRDLVVRKAAGERTPLSYEDYERWRERIDELFAELERARDASHLPEEAPNRGELESFLVELRLSVLDSSS